MTVRKPQKTRFSRCRGREVEMTFDGGDITSDGGAPLLREMDRRLGLTAAVARALPDRRQPGKVRHSLLAMIRQRVFGIALGYEDLNNHTELRDDLAFQTAVSRDERLASAATLCRLENRADPRWIRQIHEVLVDTYIASHRKPPKEIVLDFDATDDPVHGEQRGRHFNGFYDGYCFLPLYVFAGDYPLVALLRRGNAPASRHALYVLKALVKRLRAAWPGVRIVLRADGGFWKPKLADWCEDNGVDYVIGVGKNKRLKALVEQEEERAEAAFDASGEKQRRFVDLRYRAGNWRRERRVVARLEHSIRGRNPRFVVTTLDDPAQALYEKRYCARGDMENRIKEQQLDLFADRTSAQSWWANQFRLLLATLSYVLIVEIRRCLLAGTALARAQAGTIRLKLFKIGAEIRRNSRRVRFIVAAANPRKALLETVTARLKPG